MTMRNEIQALMTAYEEAVEAVKKTTYESQLLDLQKRTVLAAAMQSADAQGHKAVSAQEREAYASTEYTQYTQALAIALAKHAEAKALLEGRRLAIELWRTEQARARVELEALRSDPNP